MFAAITINDWRIVDASRTVDAADPTLVHEYLCTQRGVPGAVRITECWDVWTVAVGERIGHRERANLSEQEAALAMQRLGLPSLEEISEGFADLYRSWDEDPMTLAMGGDR